MNQFFLYLDRRTWLHRLDPRAKVLSLLGIFVMALLFTDPRYLAGLTAFLLAATATSGALPNLRKMWLLLMLLFLYCVLLWPFFVTGRTPLLSVAGRQLTREAIAFGIGMGLRLDLMLLGGVLLLSTTTIEEFVLALNRLGLPSPMAFALSLAFRWVPSLIGLAGVIVQAQRSRGLDLAAGHALARIRRYPPLIVPLIGHTLRQTRLLAMALESKGFGTGAHRTAYLELRMRTSDYVSMAIIAAMVVASLWLAFTGHGTLEVRF